MSFVPPFRVQANVPQKYLGDFLRAESHVEKEEHDKAAAIYRRILRQAPRNLVAARNLGAALDKLNQIPEALAVFQEALKHHPRDSELHYNAGVLLQRLHRSHDALAHYRTAVALNPRDMQACENLTTLLMNLGDFAGAQQTIDHILCLEPTRPGTLFTLGLLLLMQGQWHDGWHLYEYRWETEDFKTDNPDGVIRRWASVNDLRGRRVLLAREQGYGDSLQFCRYALLLAHYGAHVTMVVQDSLLGLMQSLNRFNLPNPIEIINYADFDPKAHYDYWLPLMSAPLLLLKDYPQIPAITKYIAVEASEIEQARQRLPANGRPNIGLVWSGNPIHKNDQHRSAPFAQFARLLSADANFHIIQTEVRADDEPRILAHADRLIDQRPFLTDFRRTAALLECMDLVIAVDTSIVHLAGALGRPTWVALAYTPDFRWMLQREDSPWYPTLRLMRQQQYDDWDGLITRIQGELDAWLAQHQQAATALPPAAARQRSAELVAHGQTPQALEVLQHTLTQYPNESDLHHAAGVLLQGQHRTQEAVQHYRSAVALNPRHLQAEENLATLLMHLGDLDGARQHFEHILSLEPTRPGTLFTLGLLLLLQGQWHDGWHLYEYRWETEDFKTANPDGATRPWTSVDDLRGRSVLLTHEQGHGDTVQFCRYALLLAQYGARVTLVVQDELKDVLQSLDRTAPQAIEVIAQSERDPHRHHDYQLPLLSAPLALLAEQPRAEAIARYIAVTASEIEHARQRLPANGRPNIGLVWSGNPIHKNDQHRSAPFAQFARLLSAAANFHILQTEVRADDEPAILAHADRLIDQRPFLTDFRRTAALLECMDLVIAVDTSIVHLAGALGRPTWVALAYTPDFRWMLQREDSPWYPTLRLMRQQQYDDWDGLITRIQGELDAWLQQQDAASTLRVAA